MYSPYKNLFAVLRCKRQNAAALRRIESPNTHGMPTFTEYKYTTNFYFAQLFAPCVRRENLSFAAVSFYPKNSANRTNWAGESVSPRAALLPHTVSTACSAAALVRPYAAVMLLQSVFLRMANAAATALR